MLRNDKAGGSSSGRSIDLPRVKGGTSAAVMHDFMPYATRYPYQTSRPSAVYEAHHKYHPVAHKSHEKHHVAVHKAHREWLRVS